MDITPIKKDGVTQRVYERMQELLSANEWKKGDRLPSENVLAQKFGVSRSSIRSALQRLCALGALETRHGEGTFVRGGSAVMMNPLLPRILSDRTNIFELMELRRILECESARLAAERHSQKDLDDLRSCLEQMHQTAGDLPVNTLEDLEFHLVVARATHNSLIHQAMLVLKEPFQIVFMDVIAILGVEHGIDFHERLLRAIEHRNGDSARALMAEHIDETVALLKKHLS